MGRRSRLHRDKRKAHALWSQNQLIGLLKDSLTYTPEQRSRFATHLIKVSRRHRIRLPGEVHVLVCKACNTLLRYGDNGSIRFRNGHKIQTCFSCNSIRRIPYRHHSTKVEA